MNTLENVKSTNAKKNVLPFLFAAMTSFRDPALAGPPRILRISPWLPNEKSPAGGRLHYSSWPAACTTTSGMMRCQVHSTVREGSKIDREYRSNVQLRRPDGVAVQLLPSSTSASRFHIRGVFRYLKFARDICSKMQLIKENNCPRPFLPNFLLEPFPSLYV